MQIDFAEQNFFLAMGGFGKHAPEGVAEKRPSPEFESLARHGIAADVARLKANAIHHANVNPVRNCVRPLNGAPGVMLRFTEFGLLRRMPPDSRGIKKNTRALQGCEPRALRIPLIPADKRAESSRGSIKSLEAKIAGSEIEFFVVKRIVGNVHLAVNATQCAIRIKNSSRVVIKPRCALLEERRDQHDFIFPSGGSQLFRARARNRLRQIEQDGIFALAEILRLEELGQTNDVGTLVCCLRNAIERLRQIVGRLWAACHLNQRDGEFIWHCWLREVRRICHPDQSE